MNNLLAAAKAVIDADDIPSRCNAISKLRAAVERAESQKATGFYEWAENNNLSAYGRACSIAAWTAAQQAERERIRARVVELGKNWILDTTIQQYADLLLEDQ